MKSSLLKSMFFVVLFFALVITGCEKKKQSKFLEEVIKEDNLTELVKKIKEENILTKEEMELMQNGLIKLSENKDSLVGKKVKDVIEFQRNVLKEIAYNNLYNTAVRTEIGLNLKFNFTQKLKLEKDTMNYDGIEFFINNRSKKDIVGIKGAIQILNNQNQLVKIKPINYENIVVKAGEQIMRREFWNHNPKNVYDSTYRNTTTLTAIWVPEEVKFADGKVLSILQK